MKNVAVLFGWLVTWGSVLWPLLKKAFRTALEVIGLAGVPGDIQTWRGAFPDMSNPINILAILIGLLCLLYATHDLWLRKIRFWPGTNRTTSITRPPRLRKTDKQLSGAVSGKRDDYDVIAVGPPIIRGTRTDDGIDIAGVIRYRNRSKKPVQIKSQRASFVIDGKSPEKISMGVSTPIGKEHTDGIRFLPVRVYSDKPVEGHAHFSFMFGASRETMRTVISMTYEFTVASFPQDKSTDVPLKLENLRENVQYIVKERV